MNANPDVAFNEFLFGFFAVVFVWCAIGAAVGAVAGHFVKGKPLDGAIYGGLLGLLGVGVFLLVAEDIRVKCPACLAVVNRGASRCKNCGGQL